MENNSVKAVYNPFCQVVPGGPYEGTAATTLVVHSTCRLKLDIVVLTFVIAEKMRRDTNHTKHEPAYDDEAAEAGIESGMG